MWRFFKNMSIISSHDIPCVVLVGSIGARVIFCQYGKVFSIPCVVWVGSNALVPVWWG